MADAANKCKLISKILIILLNQKFIQAVPLLVCPVNWRQEEKLLVYHHNLFCNQSVNCTDIEIAFPGLSVIALHHGEWKHLDTVLPKLSSCGIKINVAKISGTIPEHVCSFDQQMGIFSFTSFGLDFIQKKSGLRKCTVDYPSENDEFLKRLSSKCPSTYWLFGNKSCDGNASSTFALKVNRLAEGDVLLSKNTIRVGTYPATPFVNKEIDENGNVTYSGLVIEILSKIGESYNLQFKYSLPDDEQYGSSYSDTAWNGLIGMLQRKEVDIVATDLTITYPRRQVVDFSAPYYYESYSILMQLPKKSDQNFWTIIHLFTPMDWLAIIMSLLFASFYVHLLPEINNDGAKSGFKNLSYSFWYIYSGLVGQGGEIIPQTLAARAFLIFWWIYVLLITSIYSGCLIAIVTKSNLQLPFKDVAGLVKAVASNRYKICIINNTAFQAAVFTSSEQDSTTLQKFFEQNPSYLANSEEFCVKKLLSEPNVVFVDQVLNLQNVQNKYCLEKTFILLNDYFYSRYFGFAFQKGSTLNDLFSEEILNAMDTGMIPFWKSRHSPRPKFCLIVNPDEIISVENEPLKIEEIAGAFILLVTGIVFSMVYFIVEKGFQRRTKKKHFTVKCDKM